MSGQIIQNRRSARRNKLSQRRKNSSVVIRPIPLSSDASQTPQTDFNVEISTSKSTSSETRTRQPSRQRPKNGVTRSLFYVLRLGIFGVGLSAIAGTILTVFDPTPIMNSLGKQFNLPEFSLKINPPNSDKANPESEKLDPQKSPLVEDPFSLSQPLPDLETKLNTIIKKQPKLTPGLFFVDLDKGTYVTIKGEEVVSAASTIKIPVLVAFFEDVDAGKIYLDEEMVMSKDVIAGGSGDMQYQQVGKKFTALEVATKMIVISDNTATNMLIKRLGGKEVLNERFKAWGLNSTVINELLPDLKGTNTTTPKDLAFVLARVNKGELISLKSRDRMLGIMQETKTRTLLPQGLEKDAVIAHKTGDIGTVLGDAGIVDMPSGKRYIGSVLVKRPFNDVGGRIIIQDISRTVYQHFKAYDPRPKIEPQKPIINPPAKPPEKKP